MMPDAPPPQSGLSPAAVAHYDEGHEARRLAVGPGQLERVRTRELLDRFLPAPPAEVLDVGGGAGIHALWLAARGYAVDLIDAVPLHVEQAREASTRQPEHPLRSVHLGDARTLAPDDSSFDAALLLGPLYHLTEREDRVEALREAARVVRPGGVVLAAVISRFASSYDGLFHGLLDDPEFARIAAQDLEDGQHRNPTGHPHYFTTAYFHHPDEPRAEIEDAGLAFMHLLGIEGPGWLLHDFAAHWDDPDRRERLLGVVRALEGEPSLAGASSHLMVVGKKLEG